MQNARNDREELKLLEKCTFNMRVSIY